MSNLLSFLFSFYGISVIIANPVALILIIYSGIQLIVSAGNKEKVQKAKKTLTYALVGLVLVYLSFPILHIIGDLTGTTCILVGINC